MTARSELFVDETIRDAVVDILRKRGVLEGQRWVRIEVPEGWRGIWSESEYPATGEARILASNYENDVEIGRVSWSTRFFVDESMGGRSIGAEPEDVRVQLTRA